MWFMLAGRILMGISMGFYAGCSGRVIEEFTPPQLYGLAMTILMFLQQGIISLLIIIAGAGMPDEDDLQGLKTTQYWRVFIGFPVAFVFIALLMLYLVIKHETPKYLLSIGDEAGALKAIQYTYHKDENHH